MNLDLRTLVDTTTFKRALEVRVYLMEMITGTSFFSGLFLFMPAQFSLVTLTLSNSFLAEFRSSGQNVSAVKI